MVEKSEKSFKITAVNKEINCWVSVGYNCTLKCINKIIPMNFICQNKYLLLFRLWIFHLTIGSRIYERKFARAAITHKNEAALSYTSEMQFLEHFSQQSI